MPQTNRLRYMKPVCYGTQSVLLLLIELYVVRTRDNFPIDYRVPKTIPVLDRQGKESL